MNIALHVLKRELDFLNSKIIDDEQYLANLHESVKKLQNTLVENRLYKKELNEALKKLENE